MKVFRLYFIIIFAMNAASQSSFAETELLKSFRWEHRIILFQAPMEKESSIIAKFEASKTALDERHILWFLIGGDSLSTNYDGVLPESFPAMLSEAYFSQSDEIAVYLIGKDGGLKAQQKDLDLKELFRRVDSMPMRRLEMLGR